MNTETVYAMPSKLILEDYFLGPTRAWGLFEDRLGKIRRQFVVDIDGRWDGESLVLEERFAFDDGERSQRVWRITRIGTDRYRGVADDLIGEAQGRVRDNALNWQYDMRLKIGNGSIRVHFDDWMLLQPGGVILNRARVTKYGITLGQVLLSFQKPGVAEPLSSPATAA